MTKEFLGEDALARLLELIKNKFEKYPDQEAISKMLEQYLDREEITRILDERVGNLSTALDEILALQAYYTGETFDEIHEYAEKVIAGGGS